MTEAFVAFGSNVGDRAARIEEALDLLARHMRIEQVSDTYETEPLYLTNQRDYLNGVVRVSTSLGPISLVKLLKRLEVQMGRSKAARNSPRVIDLDLLLYGSLRLRSTGNPPLHVPHPGLHDRRFVLEPLLDAARADDPRRAAWQRHLDLIEGQGCRRLSRGVARPIQS